MTKLDKINGKFFKYYTNIHKYADTYLTVDRILGAYR